MGVLLGIIGGIVFIVKNIDLKLPFDNHFDKYANIEKLIFILGTEFIGLIALAILLNFMAKFFKDD